MVPGGYAGEEGCGVLVLFCSLSLWVVWVRKALSSPEVPSPAPCPHGACNLPPESCVITLADETQSISLRFSVLFRFRACFCGQKSLIECDNIGRIMPLSALFVKSSPADKAKNIGFISGFFANGGSRHLDKINISGQDSRKPGAFFKIFGEFVRIRPLEASL